MFARCRLDGRVQSDGASLVVDVLHEELVLGAKSEHPGLPDEVACTASKLSQCV